MKRFASCLALIPLFLAAAPAPEPAKPALSPNEIVAAAPASDWVAIAASDLLVMDLAPSAKAKARRVVIQLMPPPFSQGWIGNIRKLAAAHWWDGTSINRVQDNYVVQWGDVTEKKALPVGLSIMTEANYIVTRSEARKSFGAENEPSLSIEITSQDRRILPNGKNMLVVAGRVKNTSNNTKTTLPIMVEAKDADGRTVYSFVIRPLKSSILPGEVQPFSGAQLDTPKSMTTLTLAFETQKARVVQAGQPLSLKDQYTPGSIVILRGWPLAWEDSAGAWPIHCYAMVGVGRNLSPDTGSGAELYTVIGHAPRHLDRNIALVGRVIEGIEHLSSLPRGTEALGFYKTAEERVPILSVRIASEMEGDKPLPTYEYLSTESESFAAYADARANRRDPFFIQPAGGADICNIPVPVRRVK